MTTGEKAFLIHEYREELKTFAHKPLKPGTTEQSFLALVNFFEAVAHKQPPRASHSFPVEILSMTLRYLDQETWRAWKNVSQTFRDVYQIEMSLHERTRYDSPHRGNIDSEENDRNQEEVSGCDESESSQPTTFMPKESFRRISHAGHKTDSYRIVLGNQKDRCRLLPGIFDIVLGDQYSEIDT